MEAALDQLSMALVGSPLCNECGTDGTGCTQEAHCHFLKKQRNPGSGMIVEPHKAKEIALKWQEGRYSK